MVSVVGPRPIGKLAAALAFVAAAALDANTPAWLEFERLDAAVPLSDEEARVFLDEYGIKESALDTLIPFGERDEQTITLDVTLTMANERFGMELALLLSVAVVALAVAGGVEADRVAVAHVVGRLLLRVLRAVAPRIVDDPPERVAARVERGDGRLVAVVRGGAAALGSPLSGRVRELKVRLILGLGTRRSVDA